MAFKIFENIKDIILLNKYKNELYFKSVKLNTKYNKLVDEYNKKIDEKNKLDKDINIRKEEIYKQVRRYKEENNKLISLKTCEIEINTDKKTILDRVLAFIPFIKKTVYDNSLIGLYINNGVGKIINIPQLKAGATSLLNQEMYNIEEYNDAITLNNKKLIFINNKTIFNPKLDVEKKSFIFNIIPEYYWRLCNQTFDYNLTIPKTENKGFDLKKIIIIGVIIFGAYMLLSQKKV